MPKSDSSSVVPHLSPSHTSSVDSAYSSLPSPRDSLSELIIEGPDPKFPSPKRRPRQPTVRRMSTSEALSYSRKPSCSSSSPPCEIPPRRSTRVETPPPLSPKPRFHPYPPKTHIPSGLKYAARALGITFPADLAINEVQGYRDTFIDALSAMPDRILLSAFNAKRADRDCIAQRVALTTAEIKSSQQHVAFLSAMREQHSGDLTISEEQLQILDHLLGLRGLSELEQDAIYYQTAQTHELTTLGDCQSHVNHIQSVIGSRSSRWLQITGGVGNDPFSRGLDSDESCENEEEFPTAPTSYQCQPVA
ncbi:hypothetical protein OG21DRAFT_1488767 [Imleria badia]|nr:hypothetical protein OG21DRAFT_1488767 [Imleria badia]